MQQSWRERTTRAAIAGMLAIAATLFLFPRPAFSDVQYLYDASGRLTQVVDPSGESAQYVYDAAGNIVQIVRIPAGNVSIVGFQPKSGPIGTSVTIQGTGFSATPASNTVQFNGTAATVTSASAHQLVASVPAGATTGTISVTVGAQSATSAESFTVTSGAGAPPTITGFSPGGGPAGTAVTITGTNFDTVLLNNTVRFNVSQAAVTSVGATQIVASVPTFAGSGPISVRTLYGTAQSADDFVIPPAGYVYADIIARTRVVIDGPSGSLAVGTANKHGMVLFDGAAGDYISLQLSALAVSPSGPVAYKVFDTTNTQIASGNVSSTVASIHLPRLTRTGTHTIIFSPGAATANLTFVLARNTEISSAQPVLNANVPVAGQSIRGIFAGITGQPLTLRLAVPTTTPANQNVTLTLQGPDGAQLAQSTGSPSTDGLVINLASLPASGKYRVLVVPSNAATATMTVTLNPAMDVVVDGASINVSGSAPGYSRRLTFAGTAGQRVSTALTGLSYNPGSGSASFIGVYKPDGTQLAAWTNNCHTANPGGNCWNVYNALPVTGTYTVVITPPTNMTFSGTLTVTTVLTGTLVSGTPYSLELTRPGHHGRLTFSGTAGQPATVRLGIGTTAPAAQSVSMSIYRSNGTLVLDGGSASASNDGMVLNVPSLPATDTYYVYVFPWFNATGTMTVTLNPAMDVVVDGPSINVSGSAPSYSKRLTFTGTAGQRVSTALTGLGYNPASGGATFVGVYKPDGTQLPAWTNNCYTGNPGGNCWNVYNALPVTGTYTVVITPPTNITFSGTLTVTTVLTGTLVSGTPYSLELIRPGHHGRLSFSGTAGQPATVRLGIGATTPAAQNVSMSIYNSSGLVADGGSASAANDGIVVHIPSLPATDTYLVYVFPWFNATGTMTVTLNPAMDLVVDAAPSIVSTTAAGHTKRFLFNATAGQKIGIGTRDHAHTPPSSAATNLTLYSPSGSNVSSMNCTTSGVARCELNVGSVTGPYTVAVTPPAGVNFSGTITLSNAVTGAIDVNGAVVPVSLSRDGQDAWLTFSGTTGQLLRLNVSSMVTGPTGQTVTFQFWKPNGTWLANHSPSSAASSFDIPTLDATGTYQLYISPWWGATATMNVWITTR
jgi:YD repeat-containing protein